VNKPPLELLIIKAYEHDKVVQGIVAANLKISTLMWITVIGQGIGFGSASLTEMLFLFYYPRE